MISDESPPPISNNKSYKSFKNDKKKDAVKAGYLDYMNL